MGSCLYAQDFQCSISVNANQVTGGSNQQRYNDLQQKLYQFVHDRKWCQYTLKTNERIECALQINLTKVSGDVMEGTMTIILQRPVYKASYKPLCLTSKTKTSSLPMQMVIRWNILTMPTSHNSPLY